MAQSAEVISHWHQSVEGLSTSTMEFYEAVEKALREKEIADLRMERIAVSEHGILSAKREYLGVSYGRLRFDICGAPFGKDFFFSWWLVKRSPGFAGLLGCASIIGVPLVALVFIGALGFIKGVLMTILAIVIVFAVLRSSSEEGWAAIEDAILAMPVLGVLYAKFIKPVTYYSEDTRLMFEETVHRVVLQVVSGILTINKLPAIQADQLKPQAK